MEAQIDHGLDVARLRPHSSALLTFFVAGERQPTVSHRR